LLEETEEDVKGEIEANNKDGVKDEEGDGENIDDNGVEVVFGINGDSEEEFEFFDSKEEFSIGLSDEKEGDSSFKLLFGTNGLYSLMGFTGIDAICG
jgi:hypothetical protein